MATNTIALLAKPVELDPTEMPTKMANLRHLSLQNRRGRAQAGRRTPGRADDQTARTALRADPTGGDGYLKGLASAGNVKGYFAGAKANADVAKTKAETGKDAATATKRSSRPSTCAPRAIVTPSATWATRPAPRHGFRPCTPTRTSAP
jgi:hypothetical protein